MSVPSSLSPRLKAAAARLVRPGSFEVASVTPPEPGPGQVRFRVEGCGLCGSNLPAWEGREWFQYPFEAGAPGHEAWGVVDAVGPGVTDLSAGQRIACLSYRAFAEFDVAAVSAAVALPDGLAGVPFPAEPLACALNAFRRCELSTGQTVVVIGVGFLGALLIQLARAEGCRVVAVSRRPFSQEIARRCGADVAAGFDDLGPVYGAIGGEGCGCVVEAIGSQGAIDLATDLVGVRGRLVLAGYHQDGPRTVNMQQWNWKGIDVVNAHERDPRVYLRGMREAVAAVLDGRLRPDGLLTHRFPLSRINEAFETARDRPDGFLKAWIDMSNI